MISRWLLFVLPFLLLTVPSVAATGSHYIPGAGDRFEYSETIALGGGTGNYSGYSENTAVTGTVGVTSVLPNGTESASFSNSVKWSNDTGAQASWSSSGDFTFSASTFLYVQGTDNQTGYTNPSVWFYIDNSLGRGAPFSILNTAMNVVSTNYSYSLGAPLSESVATIYGEGNGSYERNDAYGVFTATYNWKAYYDPTTGYIVGYLYTEQDSDGAGDGFTINDLLFVTSTTFHLTPATSPGGSSSGASSPYLLVGVVVGILIVVLLVVWLVVRSRRSPTLPRHSAGGNIGYGPPAGGVPPPIHLTPSGQPAVQQIVMRETVKVNCRYCGALIDTTDAACPNCGAPRT
jgi:hypothetical protein